jgi:hypothetical protein
MRIASSGPLGFRKQAGALFCRHSTGLLEQRLRHRSNRCVSGQTPQIQFTRSWHDSRIFLSVLLATIKQFHKTSHDNQTLKTLGMSDFEFLPISMELFRAIQPSQAWILTSLSLSRSISTCPIKHIILSVESIPDIHACQVDVSTTSQPQKIRMKSNPLGDFK